MNALGIDIGGTFIKYAIVNEEMKIIKHWKKETKLFDTKDQFYDYLCTDIDTNGLFYVGVSAPGVIEEDSTIISHAALNVRIMYQTNVNKEIKERLHLPVQTINDAKGAGYCELRIGNGQGTKSSAYFIIGTAIGGCLGNETGIIQGVDKVAGEFSNLPVGYEENDSFRLKGLHTTASMTALITMYNEQTNSNIKYGQEITDLYLQGDSNAIQVVEQWCKNIVLGLNTIVMMYNPEVICIGGGISKADWFMYKIQSLFNTVICMDEPTIHTKIKRCKFDNDANILGAVLYAKETLEL